MPHFLEVVGVSKAYPGLPVLREASFAVDEGEIVCLLGPSGGGKTTLLRIVAGLEEPDTGQVLLNGVDLAGTPVHRRNFGFMFQDYALFPHRNVTENIAFGLRMQGLAKDEIAARVAESLALVALTGYERRPVVELSGGEQQRVALARSLAPRPQLLMLDEPLGSLDRSLREQLMNELREILKQVGLTALYVTHDQGEAFAVADRVLIMRADPHAGGWIEQDGTPAHVYRHPASTYVARFLGFKNLLGGTLAQMKPVVADTPLGLLQIDAANAPGARGDRMTVLIRPEAAELRSSGETGPNIIHGVLLNASFRGSYYLIRTRHADDIELTLEVSGAEDALPAPGQPIALWLDPIAIACLPA